MHTISYAFQIVYSVQYSSTAKFKDAAYYTLKRLSLPVV